MATYQDFLAKLLALGAKLPEIWAVVQRLIDDVQQLIILVSGTQPKSAMPMSVTPDEEDLENQVLTQLGGHGAPKGAIGDGMILRAVWQFLQAHPELVTLLLSILTAK